MKMLERGGDYVVTTPDIKTHFKPKAVVHGKELTGFGDSTFDSCPDTSRSKTGILGEFANCPVVFRAIWQKFVALSSAEAELAAFLTISKEIVWLRRVLADIGFPQSGPTNVYCDNNAAIILASNNIATRPRTKHILRRFNWIRDQVRNQLIKPTRIAGIDNPADFYTKTLSKRLFLKGRDRHHR
jgi:hypothetical protein